MELDLMQKKINENEAESRTEVELNDEKEASLMFHYSVIKEEPKNDTKKIVEDENNKHLIEEN
jgi:hypothetical protein